jgi:hypothetical protein
MGRSARVRGAFAAMILGLTAVAIGPTPRPGLEFGRSLLSFAPSITLSRQVGRVRVAPVEHRHDEDGAVRAAPRPQQRRTLRLGRPR